MRYELLLHQSNWEFGDSSEEISEILVEHERLDAGKDSEGESFEGLLEPHLLTNSAINLTHYLI